MKNCDVNSKMKISGVPNFVEHIICEYTESQEAPEHFFIENSNVLHEEKKVLQKFERDVFCWISNDETI
jgi:hypothetical protein